MAESSHTSNNPIKINTMSDELKPTEGAESPVAEASVAEAPAAPAPEEVAKAEAEERADEPLL